MDKRPTLNNQISIKDFQDFYWLKEELLKFCRSEGLRTTGSKIEIAKSIINYLETGIKNTAKRKSANKHKSKFDWHSEKLTLNTIITDNYKNTQNVRLFFQNEIGKNFKFNVKFMNWMKANGGKTLADAIEQWKFLKVKNNTNKEQKNISPQFEYNRYLRDFLADNPNLNRAIGIKLWKVKKTLRGDNLYCKEDLKLLQ